MDQSNNIANFGKNIGNPIASYIAGSDQKRQKTNDFYNRIFQQDQLKKQDEQIEYKRQQDQYNKEKELSLGAVRALASTNDPNQRAQIWQGYRQTAINKLNVDASLIPETYSDEGLYKLAGATGFDLRNPLPGSKSGKTANIADYEYYQQLRNSDPEGAELFAKDVGLLNRDKPISSNAEKSLIDSQNNFFTLSTQAREYEFLAKDYEAFKSSLPGGVAGTFSEFIKSVSGSQDEATELRRRFAKVRLSEALKYLPPGPATDRDVAEAFKGVPKDNANRDQVVSFLRGSAKLTAIDADFQEFRSNYISANDSTKGLLPAWKKAIDNGEIESINRLNKERREKELSKQSSFTSSTGIQFTVE